MDLYGRFLSDCSNSQGDCQICGEPYEHYHVVNDMEEEERKTFMAGRGCDACHGKVPEGGRPITAQEQGWTLEMIDAREIMEDI